ncbi:hypothetical protein AVJ23_07370 [Pseudoponticoccus marisrubri]|uniref:TVP38/TMEM64 family membrane protein n=1 Tax=Pseudoponticoccus marisrubri TaxID=1685382 RepID=A0A0W7WLV6_9RHOB|nr:hypothetical protein AVJ23_07370 [Pseudoponticoccus marisrubri]
MRSLARLALLGLIAWAGLRLCDALMARAPEAGGSALVLGLLLIGYALLLALPFVPGIEIGLALLMMRGAEVAPFVWTATAAGLSLAFLVGRALPAAWIAASLQDLRCDRAAALVLRLEDEPQALRLRFLSQNAPATLRPVLDRGRHLGLALLLNLPGNALIGGGGGIALLAGVSRLFRTWAALTTLALATLPVPLLVWLAGPGILPWTR